MTDRLSYHKPNPGDQPMTRRQRAQRTLWIGLLIFCCSAMLVFSPLLLGSGGPMKFIVTLGLLGGCWGVSCLVHGTLDWIRK